MSPAGKWIRRAVFVFSMICFGWVLWPLLRHGAELRESLNGGVLLAATALGAVCYAVLSVLLALAWWWLAGIYGRRPPVRTSYSIYSRSQLAKYLPGNAFHYVSRQLLGRGAGLSHQALVASGLLELGSLLLAALLAGGAGLALFGSAGASDLVAWPWVLAVGVGGLLAWPGLDLVLRRLPLSSSWMADLPHLSLLRTLSLLGPSLFLHLLFFFGTGALLVLLVAASREGFGREAWNLFWVYPVAWMAGFVSVGAPAGVGVREAVLSLELGSVLGSAQAAAVALALRLATTGGDLLTAAAGWWLGEASPAQITSDLRCKGDGRR